jgi:hypothetical protein
MILMPKDAVQYLSSLRCIREVLCPNTYLVRIQSESIYYDCFIFSKRFLGASCLKRVIVLPIWRYSRPINITSVLWLIETSDSGVAPSLKSFEKPFPLEYFSDCWVGSNRLYSNVVLHSPVRGQANKAFERGLQLKYFSDCFSEWLVGHDTTLFRVQILCKV